MERLLPLATGDSVDVETVLSALAHHPAVRSLGFKWIRILYCCWKDHTLYDEARYQKALERRGPPLAAALRQLSTQEARA